MRGPRSPGYRPVTSPRIRQTVEQIVADAAAANRSSSSSDLYTVVVLSANSPATQNAGISRSLRRDVERGALAVQYARIRLPNQANDVPGLIVGEPLVTQAGLFELYYLFPLSAEQKTLNLVRQTVLVAGLALVLLVAAIAALVTRWVVRPVRVAAQTAERLAAGDLSQRIPVYGEDDIALLGKSFNDMANSLQQQIGRLEMLSQLQQRFTSDVSHELRTPLTTIRMAAELLYSSRDDFEPALARSAELLNNELDRFENLLAELLEISRYDAGVAYLETEWTDLVGIVERAVNANQALAARQQVQLLALTPDHPILAEVDARRVERVLRNLIGNALDHAEGKPVEVRLGADAGHGGGCGARLRGGAAAG